MRGPEGVRRQYHWRDGIGLQSGCKASTRGAVRRNNTFGTDEFLRFCGEVGATPYLTANAGSGSAREARDWLEYCSFPGDSALAALRARNGRTAPVGTPFWSVGNEPWSSGGHYSAGAYAERYLRIATRLCDLAPDIRIFACGAASLGHEGQTQQEWNHDLCARLSGIPLVDGLTLHARFTRGGATSFSEAEYYGLLGDVLVLERDLERTDALLRYYFPDRKVSIAVDEWGVRHPEAVVDNGFEQPHTLRDALWRRRSRTCLIDGPIASRWPISPRRSTHLQCLAVTEGDKMFLTPTYQYSI